jgi:hypothetical protein
MSARLKKGTTCLTLWAGMGAIAMGDRMAQLGSWVQGVSERARWFHRVVAEWGGKSGGGNGRNVSRLWRFLVLHLTPALAG